jgi:TAG lipase/steryl ester hydrolase/phospholipase A2/LPA acyltransferase
MITKAISEPASLLPLTNRSRLRYAMQQARTYESWAKAAKELDLVSGNEQWKQKDRTNLYDYATIRRRRDQLHTMRQRGNNTGLVFALEEGVHGNLGGMGRPILFSKTHFGTKKLIVDYVDTVSDALLHIEKLPNSEIDQAVKLDLFKRASHCFGRSALMFSSGGTRMYFHFGVAKTLQEQGLLPTVLSGSSAGALTCAILGTHTDEELKTILTPENIFFGKGMGAKYRRTPDRHASHLRLGIV